MMRCSLPWMLLILVLLGCESPRNARDTNWDPYSVSGSGTRPEAVNRLQAPDGHTILARVGRDIITDRELKQRILARYYGPRALNGLVRESLFSAEAERQGIGIDSEEIAAQVEQEMIRILGETFQERQRALARLELQGLGESDLRREIALEVGPALLIQAVVSHHREIEEEEILDLWRVTWKEQRRLVEHIAFPAGSDEGELRTRIEQWANNTREVLASGTPLEEAVELPVGIGSEHMPRIGSGWIRESELAGNPAFFEVFQVPEGDVLGPVEEVDYGWHLFRVVETRATRAYSEVRAQLLQQLLDEPATDEELLSVERLIRRRIPVSIEAVPKPTQVTEDGDHSEGER